MLTHVFNEQVDFQVEAQAVLREKTLEHEQHHFNHTLKGHDFVIPRNGAIGVADGGKLAFKKEEEFRKIFDQIMRIQELMADIEAGFGRLDDILDQVEEETASLEKITELLNEGDMDAARDYISSVTGQDASGMTDEEAKEWLIEKGYEHIDNIEKLKEEWTKEVNELKDKIENLPKGSKERLAAEEKLAGLEDKYRKVAENNDLIKDFHEARLAVKVIDGYDISEEGTADIKDSYAASDDIEIIAAAENGLTTKSDGLFGDLTLKDEFNPAATEENTLGTGLENETDSLEHHSTQNIQFKGYAP